MKLIFFIKSSVVFRSMGPVEDSKEAYSLDCYFRQSWTDKRLRSVIMAHWQNDNILQIIYLLILQIK